MNAANVTSFWDGEAEAWANHYEESATEGHVLRERRRRVLELLPVEGGSLLDVGCGPAPLAPDLTRNGWRWFGIDNSPQMLAAARRSLAPLGNTRLTMADVQAIPAADGVFDAGICIGVIPYFDDPADVVREMLRVVRPGGAMVISFSNRASPHNLGERLWWGARGLLGHRSRSWPIRRLDSPATATTMLESQGATVSRLVFYNFDVLVPPLDRLLPRLTTYLTRRLEPLGHTRLACLGAGFLVLALAPRTADGESAPR